MDENEQIIDETIELLQNFKSNLLSCIQSAKNLLIKLKENQLPIEDGISLFDLKNKMFLSYLIDLSCVIDQKLNTGKLEQKQVLERLVEERVVLEKIRPIEYKLKYQVDKLMKTLNTGTIDDNDPLNLKPNFSNIDGDNDNNDDEDISDQDGGNNETNNEEYDSKPKNKLYVPPRLAQMKFEDEEEKKNKALERAKKRAMSSSIIKELRREFDDAPEEEYDSLLHQKSGIGKYLKERKRFEEDNFIRINLTKKQKAQARKLSTVNSIADDITRFEDISALDIKNSSDFIPQKKSKIHTKSKKIKKKSVKKRRGH